MKELAAIMLMTVVFVTIGCSPEKEVKVKTATPRDITMTTAVCEASVEASEGVTLTELGFCWDTTKDPVANNNHLFTANCNTPYEDTIKGLMSGTEYHVRAYAYDGTDYYYGEDKSFTTDGGGSGGGVTPPVPIDTLFVDLGLPSGTLWAKCNVGANAPEEYGDYFAWGETEPKSDYSWETYRFGNYDDITKYNSDDGLIELLPSDDAATVNWGDDARTPTKEEWEELYNNTSINWTIINGVNGLCFQGVNGNTIFLPKTGEREGNETVLITEGVYWSSSLYVPKPYRAWFIRFYASDFDIINSMRFRCYGKSVRPVRSSSQN